MRLTPVVALIAAAGCGPSPCTDHCPAVAGTYSVQSSAPITQCDGTPASPLPPVGTVPTTLTLVQNRSRVSAGTWSGELTDDGDLVLHGSTDDATQADFQISAHFTEPGNLRGQSVSTFSVEGPRRRDPDLGSDGPLIQTWVSCSVSGSFTGVRISK